MGYKIICAKPVGDNDVAVQVEFDFGQKGMVTIPATSTDAEAKAIIDGIDAGYPTLSELNAALPVALGSLIGYVKE